MPFSSQTYEKLPKIRDVDILIEYTIVYVLARPNFVRPNMTVVKIEKFKYIFWANLYF